MTKIIFAEDNRSYAEDVADFLAEAGYTIEIVGNAADLWAALSQSHFDMVLLDLGLPDEDGFHIIPQLRKLYPETGLIVLTARVTTDNRIQGLRLGADSYLTKPIKFPELAAQIEALCRRVRPKVDVELPSWVLRTAGRQLELKGKGIVALTEKEFDFLHLLAQNKQPVPRKSLLFGLGENFDPEVTGKMDMLVYRLRKKIHTSLGEELPLRSEYGSGYALSVTFQIA
jgi:DNA-binding response OmpR family regulator